MTPFILEEFKRLAGERTKGEWRYEFDPLQEKSRIWTTEDTYYLFNGFSTKPNPDFKLIAYCGTHADAIVQRIEKLEKALEEIKFMSTSKAPALNSDDASHYKWIAYDCIGIATKALERGE